MATLRPLVNISGSVSELPEGDFIVGAVGGTLTTVSGVAGGGSLQQGTPLSLSASLAASPSGIIRVGDSLGLDGSSLQVALGAGSSGISALSTSTEAVISGQYASTVASQALASGNAALSAFGNIPYGTTTTFTAASPIPANYPVGLDDSNRVQVIRSVVSSDVLTPGSLSLAASAGTYPYSADIAWNSSSNRFCVAYRNAAASSYGYAVVGSVDSTTGAITSYTPVVYTSSFVVYNSVVYHAADNRFVIAWSNNSNGNLQVVSAQLSGANNDSLTFGSVITAASSTGTANFPRLSYDVTQQRTLLVCAHDSLRRLLGVSIACSSGTLTSGSAASATYDGSQLYGEIDLSYCSNSHLVTYRRINDGYGYGIAFSVSGATVSVGTNTALYSASCYYLSNTFNTTQSRFVSIITRTTQTAFIAVGTVSGTTITLSSNSTVLNDSSSGFYYSSIIYNSTIDRLYFNLQNTNTVKNRYYVYSQSGNTFTYLSQSADENFISNANAPFPPLIEVSSLRSGLQVLPYLQNYDLSGVYVRLVSEGSIIYPSKNSKQNFIGVATTTVASGSAVSVRLPGSLVSSSPTVLQSGAFYYLDPVTSGYTTGAAQPLFWTGDKAWGPVGIALDTSKILITDTM